MRVEIIDENNTTIYLNKYHTQNFDVDDRTSLEKYFKDLFIKLRNIYRLTMTGYYTIDVFLDDIYGVILEIKKEEKDFYDYFGHQIDMRITVEKNISFLYQISDYYEIDEKILIKCQIYKYHNNLYLKPFKDIDDIKLGQIIEKSKIIYKDEISDIIKRGELIKI